MPRCTYSDEECIFKLGEGRGLGSRDRTNAVQRTLTKIGKKSWTAWMPASCRGSSSTSSSGSFESVRKRFASCSRCVTPHASPLWDTASM